MPSETCSSSPSLTHDSSNTDLAVNSPKDPFAHFDKARPNFLASLIHALQANLEHTFDISRAEGCETTTDGKSNLTVWMDAGTTSLKDFRILGMVCPKPQLTAYGNQVGVEGVKNAVSHIRLCRITSNRSFSRSTVTV